MRDSGVKLAASRDIRASEPSRAGTGSRSMLPGIQILRAVAALAVVVHHTIEESYALIGPSGAPHWLVLIGASGVDLFFVISGFIMLHTQGTRAGEPGGAKRFLLRRVIRIVPLYWLCTSAILVLHGSGLLFAGTIVTPRTVISSLAFLPSKSMILSVGWTLRFEMYFYLLFAVFLALRPSAAGFIIVPALIAMIVAAASVFGSEAVRAFFTDPIALEFCFGMMVAAFLARVRPSRRGACMAFVVGCLGLLAGSIFAPSHGTAGLDREWRYLCWGIPAALLLWSALGVTSLRSPPGRLLVLLGDASYSIYLTHAFVMIAYARVIKAGIFGGAPVMPVAAAVVLISAGLGTGTYLCVERSVERRLKRLVVDGRRSRSPDVPAPAPMRFANR